MPGESSIELDLDQIKRVCKDIGFEFEVKEKENFIFEKKRRWYLKTMIEGENDPNDIHI